MTEAGLAVTLAQIVAGGGEDAPRRIGEACRDALPIDGVSITLMGSGGGQVSLYASDPVATRLDELQFSLGEGPCVDAYRHRRPVLVPELAEVGHHRWPMFATAATQTGAQALHVFPLQVGAIAIGVLALYRLERGMLTPEALAGAFRTADAVIWTLLGTRSEPLAELAEHRSDPAEWLRSAPLQHAEIYQATGMVMAQLGVDGETALARLRGYAFARDLALEEVAHDVLARRLRFNEEET